MARRRFYRERNNLRLKGVERILFILAVPLYLIGLFGGSDLLDLDLNTAIWLLSIGGGLMLVVCLTILF
jgi:hypothetical protein